MTISIEEAAINLAVAFGLSAAIGFERQWRNRLAGLRTNTLVALGAASFVVFAALVPGEGSPTRVAAQVVSGIGFLGAGLIFREGMSVRGLNTAASDVYYLYHAMLAHYQSGDESGLKAYSQTALARVWKAQRFSWWMTMLLHRFPDRLEYEDRLQQTEMSYLFSSDTALRLLAENYVGLPF